jgi:secreted trypsin-like serine protease
MELFKALALLLATTAASSAAEGGLRIFNGDDVVAGTYPWFAYPFHSTGAWDGCGGSLISAEYVLTAAHCIVDENKVPYDALDAYNIGALCAPYTQKNNCGQDVEVFSILKSIIHPSYGMPDNDNDNDFALVKLDGSANATPVNIDDGTYSPAYANGKGNLWPIGFGIATLDDFPGEYYFPERLQHVEVKYITNAKCVADYGYKFTEITSNMMCAADTPSEYRSPLQEFLFSVTCHHQVIT